MRIFSGTAARRRNTRSAPSIAAGQESPLSPETAATTRALSDDELMDMVQEANFRFYWDGAEPNSGMAVESLPGDEHQIAVGSSGFGIMALVVGVDRHFVTRQQGVERMLKIVPLSWPRPTGSTVCGRTTSTARPATSCRISASTTTVATWSKPLF